MFSKEPLGDTLKFDHLATNCNGTNIYLLCLNYFILVFYINYI